MHAPLAYVAADNNHSMQTHTTRLLIGGTSFSIMLFSLSSHAQGVLIGPSTRNGSFEDGMLTPWVSGAQVQHNAGFASDGAYYASFQSSLVRPISAVQNLLPNPSDGLTFMVSFDARMDSPGLNTVSSWMGARTPGGAPLSATVITILAPPLSASVWQTYQYELQMPAGWGAAGVTFGINFSNDQPLGGVTHTAFLDNVNLTQIPEPSALALVALGSLFAAVIGRASSGKSVRVRAAA